MRQMQNNDYLLFEQICGLTQEELKTTMAKFLKGRYKEVVETKDYVYAIGTIPIALCAHMDTVFSFPPEPNDIFYDRTKGVIWSEDGLGADDRAGVFIIIKLIEMGLRPHIIFTTDEEKGCLGAGELAKLECPFEDLRYIIQLDRRGNDDCVFYDCENPEFTEYVESFGFTENFGSFSDIYDLCPAWGVAGTNLSVGYQDEHTRQERLYVGPFLNTLNKVKKMLTEPTEEIPYFKFILSSYALKYYQNQYMAGPQDDDKDMASWDYDMDYEVQCHHCGKIFSVDDCIPVTSVTGNHYFLCIDCLAQAEDKIRFCSGCGEAFEPIDQYDSLCLHCRMEGMNTDGAV